MGSAKVFSSEQLAEFADTEAGVFDDAAHGIGVDRICSQWRIEVRQELLFKAI
jgi:hypothetical protein